MFDYRGKDLKSIRVICYRDRVRSGVREISHSIIVEFHPISFQTGIISHFLIGWGTWSSQELESIYGPSGGKGNPIIHKIAFLVKQSINTLRFATRPITQLNWETAN